MRRSFMYVSAAAGLAVLSACAAAGTGAAGPAAGGGSQAGRLPAAAAAPGSPLWVTRYNGPADGYDQAAALAVSPGGRAVFVTGASRGARSGDDYLTVAYRAATGARLWAARYTGPGSRPDRAVSVAVSPDGTRVFVTGASRGARSGDDYLTVAYRAATGARLWAARYTGPGSRADQAAAVTVSPDGTRVFVTGASSGARTGRDYVTVAYRAATGARLWAARYTGPGSRPDAARSVAVSRNGARVLVTGASRGARSGDDYATVAYSAASGAQLWARRYNGPGNGSDQAVSVAVSPAVRAVFVTGVSAGRRSGPDYATVAYSTASGMQLWARRYNGPGNAGDAATKLAVSPDGASLFVTGSSWGGGGTGGTGEDYATVAYRAAGGAQLWARRYNAPGNTWDIANSLAVSRTGTVYVTGLAGAATESGDYVTLAYRAATGAQLWARRYNGPNGSDIAHAVGVSPAGRTVFVTGDSFGTSGWDYATVAYRG